MTQSMSELTVAKEGSTRLVEYIGIARLLAEDDALLILED